MGDNLDRETHFQRNVCCVGIRGYLGYWMKIVEWLHAANKNALISAKSSLWGKCTIWLFQLCPVVPVLGGINLDDCYINFASGSLLFGFNQVLSNFKVVSFVGALHFKLWDGFTDLSRFEPRTAGWEAETLPLCFCHLQALFVTLAKSWTVME